MPLLHERDRKVFRDKLLAGLVNPVKMVVFTQEFECQYCADVRMLAEELTELADGRLKLTVLRRTARQLTVTASTRYPLSYFTGKKSMV